MVKPRMRARSLTALVALTLCVPLFASNAAPSPASALTSQQVGVGATSLATPKSGGRTIYVSPTGTDVQREWKQWSTWGEWRDYSRLACLADPNATSGPVDCPEPTITAPLLTVKTAVRVARPGDVIVVRAGTYAEAVGWGILPGTSTRPIVMQAYPGERAVISGTLTLKAPDYWTVKGLRFLYNPAVQTGESVVAISGGTGWKFSNNEVAGSVGVANVLIVAAKASSTALADLQRAAPRNYTINGNCIRNNMGTDARGTDHNIYLMSSIYSVGGLIEHNLIAGAPRGANIKAAASSATLPNASPRNVIIRYNTMLAAASGVTIGLKAEGIAVLNNIIALPRESQKYDGGVKTYQLANPGSNAVKDTLISGYTRPISEDYGVTSHIFSARLNTTTSFSYAGSVANCTAKATSSTILAKYGQYAGS